MLKNLAIEQFVIIDKLSLDLQPGLTILTGETGAGKSILLDAMGLVLGEPSSPDSIRTGSEQSVIRAIVAPPANHPAWSFLAQHGVPSSSQQFTIDRVMRKTGDDIRINDKPVDVDTLKQLGTLLVEIHGQFANQGLLDPNNQLTLLDLSGGFPPEVFTNVSNALADVRRYTKELEEEKLFLVRNKKDLPKIENIVGRFEKIGMRDQFIDDVLAEHARLRTAKETSEAFQAILAQLISGNGVVAALSAANNTLNKQQNVEKEKLVTLGEYLSGALTNARNAVAEMGRLSPEYDIDTKPLHRLEDILKVLNAIAAEANIPFAELEKFWVEITTKLNRIKNGREKIAELEKLLATAKGEYLHHARILSEKRTVAGVALSQEITGELAPLKLNKAEFKVVVEEDSSMTWTERGINRVIFTGRMNPGQPFSPIADTASGGELARMILALKVVVQRVQTIPTLVFDEVDTGIGGSAAAAVGERLALLSDTTQVLVITHSPQVASRGQQHLHVSKATDGITTTSVVRTLPMQDRVDEISRMLAGESLTEESQAAAKRLIAEAEAASVVRKAKLQQQPAAAQG